MCRSLGKTLSRIIASCKPSSTIMATLNLNCSVGRVDGEQVLETSTHTQPPDIRLDRAMALKRRHRVQNVDSSFLELECSLFDLSCICNLIWLRIAIFHLVVIVRCLGALLELRRGGNNHSDHWTVIAELLLRRIWLDEPLRG